MASISSVKKETSFDCVMNESIEDSYNRLCVDLNMDNETREDSWRSYEDIRKHYLLEGDQLHWLAVSLYVSCRKSSSSSSSSLVKSENNPISISRLLKSAHQLDLLIFFDKLHKWQDMKNLPDSIRNQIDQVEHAFNISSIIFQKYSSIFEEIFGGKSLSKSVSSTYQSNRNISEINPKFFPKNKHLKCSEEDLYSLIWTIYALTKTMYPSTINDLIASFHLLIASFLFIYIHCKRSQLDYLLKGKCFNDLNDDEERIGEKLSVMFHCSCSTTRTIYEEHLKKEFTQRFLWEEEQMLNEEHCFSTIRNINRQYDEIVLRNCIIDERIFLENSSQLNDLCPSLNENRNGKSSQNLTPLTANQHFTLIHHQSNDHHHLTPISQANQLILILSNIIGQQSNKPSTQLQQLLVQQTFLDDLLQRLNEWERLFVREYQGISSSLEREEKVSKARFDFSLKLFYNALENVLLIEKKRLIQMKIGNEQIEESFHKLILNNEFVKSLLGLCLLLVLYSHCDRCHDLNWILNIYSLHGYSFLKIIQIYLKTSKQISQARPFIKYLSAIEETIISSMAFDQNSALWNEIQNKGIITYEQILSLNQWKGNSSQSSTPPHQTPTNLSQMYFQSPIHRNVKRKLFDHPTLKPLSIIRSQSDPVTENVLPRKISPYTMFYRKFYELVFTRLDLICLRLYGSQTNLLEKYIWNFFLYLFENFTDVLFRERDLDQILLSAIYFISNKNFLDKSQLTWSHLIQAYKTMPNAKLKTLRSVFIRVNEEQTLQQRQQTPELFFEKEEKDPCLTPSKPAGTVHIIDGNVIGDIDSFYREVFLNLVNLSTDYLNHFDRIDLPQRTKRNSSQNDQISFHIGQKIFVDYSSNQIKSNLFGKSDPSNHFNSKDISNSTSTNVLSSSIQAGANNTVRTTRMRTEDGKFLTTISTISKANENEQQSSTIRINENERNLLFGQPFSSSQSFKRTLSNDSNSNSLTSLTKKVLQIENDRQKLQQN